MPTPPREQPASVDELASQANSPQPGLLREFWHFLRHNKKWWLTPIIIVLLIMGAIIVLGSTALAPFIYPLM